MHPLIFIRWHREPSQWPFLFRVQRSGCFSVLAYRLEISFPRWRLSEEVNNG